MIKVFILATCRNRDLLPYTRLVFKTLRVGFPTAEVEVVLNGALDYHPLEDAADWVGHVSDAAGSVGCQVRSISEITHHEWVEGLIKIKEEPFWILDTDVAFFAPVEHWTFEHPLAGALIPEFNDPFLKAVTRSRLHTSLMHIDPVALRPSWANYLLAHPRTIYNPPANLVHPLYMPFNGRTYFYDTMSMMYHAFGGTPFTSQQKDCYMHFHFGTFSDLVLPSMGPDVAAARAAVLADPSLGIGLWRQQEEWFNSRQFVEDGVDVIAPIKPEDAAEARKWNSELCCGNQSAMAFCDLYYAHAHSWDDLIDTMRDGRPRMSREQILSILFGTALMYNSSFFIANREMLFPIFLDVLGTYAVSVGWEQSPKEHLRKIADISRTCGNRVYYMVGLI
jgi:hypothetical protein